MFVSAHSPMVMPLMRTFGISWSPDGFYLRVGLPMHSSLQHELL